MKGSTGLKTMSTAPKDPSKPEAGGLDPDQIQEQFQRGGQFTAGFGTRYSPSLLTGGTEHQHLAAGFPVGERFHSSDVTRIADAQRIGLGHTAQADGRWRLYAVADRDAKGASPNYDALIQFLAQDPNSPLRRFTPAGADVDAVFDLRSVHQGSHTETTVADLPALLVPAKGKYGLRDYEKAFASQLVDGGEEIYEVRGIDRATGALVVVRPDQYVSMVLPLDGTLALTEFFARFMAGTVVTA